MKRLALLVLLLMNGRIYLEAQMGNISLKKCDNLIQVFNSANKLIRLAEQKQSIEGMWNIQYHYHIDGDDNSLYRIDTFDVKSYIDFRNDGKAYLAQKYEMTQLPGMDWWYDTMAYKISGNTIAFVYPDGNSGTSKIDLFTTTELVLSYTWDDTATNGQIHQYKYIDYYTRNCCALPSIWDNSYFKNPKTLKTDKHEQPNQIPFVAAGSKSSDKTLSLDEPFACISLKIIF